MSAPTMHMCIWPEFECRRQTITDIHHNCFVETFSSFMVVFTTGVRLNLTSKVSVGLFLCVYFDRNKQQPQHSWTIANVLDHFNVFFFFPWHIKTPNWLLQAQTSLAFARRMKVSVSEYFLSQFLGQEEKIHFYQCRELQNWLFFGVQSKKQKRVNINL